MVYIVIIHVRVVSKRFLLVTKELVSHHDKTDQSVSMDQICNSNWQTLFSWLSGWLLLRLSKHQLPIKILFRTTLTQKITLNEQLMPWVQTIYSSSLYYYWTEYLNKEIRSALYKYTQSEIWIRIETRWQLLEFHTWSSLMIASFMHETKVEVNQYLSLFKQNIYICI